MRIISGKHKGRRLVAPKNLPVRPTTDMCKESLFNILNNYFNLHGLKVLDLFAGTGNISYEFASRGAGPITSVDGDMGCVNFIKKTSTDLDLDISVIKSDVFKFLEKSKTSYDIIFADAPFDVTDEAKYQELIAMILNNKYLKPNGVFILEHNTRMKIEHPQITSSRKYGNITFSFIDPLPEEPTLETETPTLC